MPPRPSLPLRTQTDVPDEPPADATKPDDTAIDDVYAQVDATGSLEAAARKLAAIAAAEAEDGGVTPAVVQRRQVWDDDDEYFYQGAAGGEEGEEEEIEHLQEVYDGLWVGDLVAAMDGNGLRERGIVSRFVTSRLPCAQLTRARSHDADQHRLPPPPSTPLRASVRDVPGRDRRRGK